MPYYKEVLEGKKNRRNGYNKKTIKFLSEKFELVVSRKRGAIKNSISVLFPILT